MNEERAWEKFCQTGNINEYLLYKGVLTDKDESAAKGAEMTSSVLQRGNVNGTD